MPEVLILFETGEGHTAAVSERLRLAVEDQGLSARLLRCSRATAADLAGAAAIVVGAPIHMGRHDRRVLNFARAKREALAARPSAFFTVCLTAASSAPAKVAEVAGYQRDFQAATGWKPDLTRAFAGALLYTKYNFLKRKIMQSIAEREGGDSDTSRDYVYTDWDAVQAFAKEVRALAER